MLEIYKQIIKVAQMDFTVLIFGESGSGKELVARTIHELSFRKDHRFIPLNCAAIPFDSSA
ncbi:MAG: sigma 54-interacting transcriptional regulator [Candidatus Marinimicrobia bacterium]|nr:sigma 54-interacting transcriptional regulator [Candidatus Neomarinimicrobiota bacterium]